MTDLFDRISQRALGQLRVVRPLLAPRFASVSEPVAHASTGHDTTGPGRQEADTLRPSFPPEKTRAQHGREPGPGLADDSGPGSAGDMRTDRSIRYQQGRTAQPDRVPNLSDGTAETGTEPVSRKQPGDRLRVPDSTAAGSSSDVSGEKKASSSLPDPGRLEQSPERHPAHNAPLGDTASGDEQHTTVAAAYNHRDDLNLTWPITGTAFDRVSDRSASPPDRVTQQRSQEAQVRQAMRASCDRRLLVQMPAAGDPLLRNSAWPGKGPVTEYPQSGSATTQAEADLQGNRFSPELVRHADLPDSASSPPIIRVSIGRIEVRAAVPATGVTPAAVSGKPSEPSVTLDEYLRQRSEASR